MSVAGEENEDYSRKVTIEPELTPFTAAAPAGFIDAGTNRTIPPWSCTLLLELEPEI